MNRFEVSRASSVADARRLIADRPGSVLKAGGIDVLDHLKEHLLEPPRLVDLKTVSGLDKIVVGSEGALRIGPLVTLAQIAGHAGIRATHRALAEACGEAASPQIRNVATIGGNILQRPRCWYYRLESYKCLKKGGDVCFATGGENRYHVIFGGGPSYAPHPSNAAVALVALQAALVLEGSQGRRVVQASEFFTLPSVDAQKENALAPGEVIVEIQVPAAAGRRSTYQDLRERAAFDWPLVSLAAAIKLQKGAVAEARIVLGAVAPIPWRSLKAEAVLTGRPLAGDTVAEAAAAAVAGAEPMSDNGYKVGLVETLVRRTLLSLA